jgi:fructosamine-3-kinase/protein-tyrosine-phosphatase
MPAAELPSPREPGAPYRVCLVCLGNICRSPMAEMVLRAALATAGLDREVIVDSAGTGDWHIGQPMNSGARAALGRRGYDGSAHRARQFQASWLDRRDLVLAMDARNLADLRRMAGPEGRDRIRLFGEVGGLSDARDRDIPDPYGGDAAEFGYVLDLLSGAAPVIAARLRRLIEAAVPSGPGVTPSASASAAGSASSAGRIARQTGLAVRAARVAGSQHGYQHVMLTLAGGRRAFAKIAADAAASAEVSAAFAAEASSLRWLAEAQAVPVPEVLAVSQTALVIAMIPPGHATPEAAFCFGTELARLHAAGADGLGAPWRGFIASLPLDNTPAPPSWPQWYASRRLLPYLALAVDSGALRSEDGRLVEAVIDRIDSLAGPAEPPSRIHGDCWAGNVLWSGGRGWLIDPAAHGGHRETDLAMLALFGVPHLDRILAGYNDAVPLAAGWRDRVPLHQLHPLLVHACLFGASYREGVRSAARAALSS